MAFFNRKWIKFKYIEQILSVIENNQPFLTNIIIDDSNNHILNFQNDNNFEIIKNFISNVKNKKEIERVINNNKIKETIEDLDNTIINNEVIFEDKIIINLFVFIGNNGKVYRLNNISKSIFTKTNKNSGGASLTKEKEEKTIEAIKLYFANENNFENVIKEKIFYMKDSSDWQNTYIKTPILLKNAITSKTKLTNFSENYITIERDAELSNKEGTFSKLVKDIAQAFHFTKDAYLPADLYIVVIDALKEIKENIETELEKVKNISKISNNAQYKKELLDNYLANINKIICESFQDGNIIPISLKQIKNNQNGRYEIYNLPSTNTNNNEKIQFKGFTVNLNNLFDETKKEIGVIQLIPDDLYDKNYTITMQNKIYGINYYSKTQLEITKIGSTVGGRVGKVPVSIVNYVYNKYSHTHFIHTSFGNKTNPFEHILNNNTLKNILFTAFNELKSYSLIKCDKTLTNFKDMLKKQYIKNLKPITKQYYFIDRLQGFMFVSFLYDLYKNKKLSEVADIFIKGAKKISKRNPVYVIIKP